MQGVRATDERDVPGVRVLCGDAGGSAEELLSGGGEAVVGFAVLLSGDDNNNCFCWQNISIQQERMGLPWAAGWSAYTTDDIR